MWRGLALEIRRRNAAILAVTALTIIGPWAVRNYLVHGKMIPIKGSFWVNVWKGNNDHATGTDRVALTDIEIKRAKDAGEKFDDSDMIDGQHQYDLLTPSQKARLQGQTEIAREAVFKELATDWIKQNPAGYLRLCRIRLIKTLTIDWDNPKSYNWVYVVSRYVLLGLTIAGLFVAWRQKWSLLFPGVIVFTALLTYTLTVTAARFSIPFEPLQLCLGGAFVAMLIERFVPTQQKASKGSEQSNGISRAASHA